jgi:hypothetical protein
MGREHAETRPARHSEPERVTCGELQARYIPASANAELAEKTAVVREPDDVAAAGANVRFAAAKQVEPGDDDGRPTALDEFPARRPERESGDEVDVDRREAQVVAEPALDPRAQVKPSPDLGREPEHAD